VNLRILIAGSLLCASAACAHGQQAKTAPAPAPAPAASNRMPPLAVFASKRVIVLPSLYLRSSDSLGWAAGIAQPRDYLDELDNEIAFALGERGLKRRWIWPADLLRAAKRNPTYVDDPYDLAALSLRPPAKMRRDAQLPDPLATQLRSLVAVNEDARFALIPVEVRFEPAPGSAGERMVLHVALVDARMSQVIWNGDVMGDIESKFSPALAASVAGHLADLIVAP
jgi:hypothetical protein